jgi:hypothetical protein
MEVEVPGDAGAGDRSQVRAHVEPLRPEGPAERPLSPLEQPDQVGRLAGVEVGERGHVAVRRDQQVARGVGEQVQDHEGARAPMDDVGLPVVPPRQRLAEDAPLSAAALRILDVPHPPRGEEPLHGRAL